MYLAETNFTSFLSEKYKNNWFLNFIPYFTKLNLPLYSMFSVNKARL